MVEIGGRKKSKSGKKHINRTEIGGNEFLFRNREKRSNSENFPKNSVKFSETEGNLKPRGNASLP